MGVGLKQDRYSPRHKPSAGTTGEACFAGPCPLCLLAALSKPSLRWLARQLLGQPGPWCVWVSVPWVLQTLVPGWLHVLLVPVGYLPLGHWAPIWGKVSFRPHFLVDVGSLKMAWF